MAPFFLGAISSTTEAGLPYMDWGAVAWDQYEGNVTAIIQTTFTVLLPPGPATAWQHSPLAAVPWVLNGSLPALSTLVPLNSQFLITYTVTDTAGNRLEEKNFTPLPRKRE